MFTQNDFLLIREMINILHNIISKEDIEKRYKVFDDEIVSLYDKINLLIAVSPEEIFEDDTDYSLASISDEDFWDLLD